MTRARLSGLVTAALLTVGCHDFTGPEPLITAGPALSHAGTGAGLHGAGSIGDGAAVAGANRQDFDFDVATDLTGTVSYRDWAVVRNDGTVATVTVGSSDPETEITAFRDGSTLCADGTRGAEIDGVGRLDTGELVAFTIVGCDSGPEGSGADGFRMSVPSAGGYLREGLLSAGDIVKSNTAVPPPTRTQVSGLGTIGDGTATPGSNRQEFDFEANAALSGRLDYVDHGVVRGDGTVGRLMVDTDTDPETGVTSYQQISTTCVRVGGNGRIDTGELWAFVIDACDNASSGAGFDTFAIDLPGRGYTRSGALTSGDITLGGGTGDLDVTTTTTGEPLDPDGYTVTVDETTSQPIPVNSRVTFAALSAGSHTVTLSGLASNCTVSGGNSRTVAVPAGEAASTAFTVTCASGPPTRLAFTVQPSRTKARSTIEPPVQVAALDAQGNRATTFNGLITIAIGRNGGGLLTPGRLSGTKTARAVNGVATFADLSIDRAGEYTLRVTSSGLSGAESQSFRIDSSGLCLLVICIGG